MSLFRKWETSTDGKKWVSVDADEVYRLAGSRYEFMLDSSPGVQYWIMGRGFRLVPTKETE